VALGHGEVRVDNLDVLPDEAVGDVYAIVD